MSELGECCENCRFWLAIDKLREADETDTLGVCRRYPPQPDVRRIMEIIVRQGREFETGQCYEWSQPDTPFHDWCGEWKPVEPKDRDEWQGE